MPEETQQVLTTIKASPAMADWLRTIAAMRGMSIPEALDKYGNSIEREYRKVIRERYEEIGEAGA